jgi:hypothetical protein
MASFRFASRRRAQVTTNFPVVPWTRPRLLTNISASDTRVAMRTPTPIKPTQTTPVPAKLRYDFNEAARTFPSHPPASSGSPAILRSPRRRLRSAAEEKMRMKAPAVRKGRPSPGRFQNRFHPDHPKRKGTR